MVKKSVIEEMIRNQEKGLSRDIDSCMNYIVDNAKYINEYIMSEIHDDSSKVDKLYYFAYRLNQEVSALNKRVTMLDGMKLSLDVIKSENWEE